MSGRTALLAGRFDAGEEAAWQAALAAALPDWRIATAGDGTAAAAIEVALVANPAPGALAGLPRLQFIQSLWAGVERLLADPTVPPAVPLARMVDPAMTAAMAETALWAVLGLHRGYFTYQRQQREGRWQPLAQRRADECRVLLLGLGELGRGCQAALAQRGYALQAWRRRCGRGALPALLAASDIVVNLLPLTNETRGLLDAAFFAALPRGAGVVNLARGAHVVEADLLAALATGQVGHAVLDVFQTEPLPAGHAFWAHPQVTVLPHAAAQTDPRSAARVVARNLEAWTAGRPPEFLVDRGRGY